MSRSLMSSTFYVTLFSFLGIGLGFLNQLVVAYYFGANFQRDAYFGAMVIPTYISTLLIGSVGVIFMSSYIEYDTNKTQSQLSLFTSRVVNICGLVLFLLSVIVMALAENIITFVMPGFTGEKLHLAIELLRILSPTLFFLVMSNLLTTIYQVNNLFLWPAAVPIIGIIISLLVVIAFSKTIGIKSLAYGTLASAILNFVLLSSVVFRKKKYNFSFIVEKEIITMFKVAAPLLLAGIFYRSTSVFERSFASSLETGSISYLGYANQMMNVLSAIAAGGVATTIYPAMAKCWELKNLEAVRNYFSKGIRIILLTTLPIAAIVISVGTTVIEVLLQRGAFNAAVTHGVTRSLVVFMPAFICLSLGNIVAKGFYLSNRTKTFSAIVSFEAINYICCGYVLVQLISYLGLAAASSISTFITIFISFFVLRKLFNGINGKMILRGFLEIAAASVCMGLIIWIINVSLITHIEKILSLSISCVLGLSLYTMLIVYAFRIEEAVVLKEKVVNSVVCIVRRSKHI
jgi:putative peptidoglycan lipid II flippase